MKKICIFYFLIFGLFFLLGQSVIAEDIKFNDATYKLKVNRNIEDKEIIENEYYKPGESKKYWTSMFGVYHYLKVNNPLKFASETDKKIEANNKCLLLKFVQNKKQDVAVISYLENGAQNDKTFFIYSVYKYAKHPNKGMLVLRFSKKYIFNSNEEIVELAKEVRKINDEYIEKMIITPIPQIVTPDKN